MQVDRFEEKINRTPTCWLWIGCVNSRYGKFKYKGISTCAHRVSYELYKGPIPVGKYVCHTCDNPICVNPDHLFLGDQSDNMKDMSRKFRRHNQKLSSQQWKVIQQDTRLLKEIAQDYGVSFQLISRIKLNKDGRYS